MHVALDRIQCRALVVAGLSPRVMLPASSFVS
jgi:hypothetical protein